MIFFYSADYEFFAILFSISYISKLLKIEGALNHYSDAQSYKHCSKHEIFCA